MEGNTPMTKILVVLIGGAVLIVLFMITYRLTGSGAIPETPQTATSTTGGNAGSQTVTGPSVSSPTAPSGGGIEVKGVMEDPDLAKDPLNPGYYYLGYHTNQGSSTDPTATTTPPYIIEYIASTHYFNIALLQEPIGMTREAMQRYLMAHLGMSQDQMCKLDYMVSVPAAVNEHFSGMNVGFSFCPKATILPQ
jgi:hypothetical protein